MSERVRKVLTANDLGTTGSHQSGIHVPRSLAGYFPPLDGQRLNPDTWLDITTTASHHRWRLIHYNNGVLSNGTRDEYRLTHVRRALAALGAGAGDTLELERTGPVSYRARLLRRETGEEAIVLSTDGRWRVVSMQRTR